MTFWKINIYDSVFLKLIDYYFDDTIVKCEDNKNNLCINHIRLLFIKKKSKFLSYLLSDYEDNWESSSSEINLLDIKKKTHRTN